MANGKLLTLAPYTNQNQISAVGYLSNRKDTSGTVKLYYRVKRSPASDYIGWMWFDLEKEPNGWKVTNIEAIY